MSSIQIEGSRTSKFFVRDLFNGFDNVKNVGIPTVTEKLGPRNK
jgi:hypothetical protein